MPDRMPAPYKRYLLFGYDTYYPQGGEDDVQGSFDTIEEARAVMRAFDSYELLDLQERVWVALY